MLLLVHVLPLLSNGFSDSYLKMSVALYMQIRIDTVHFLYKFCPDWVSMLWSHMRPQALMYQCIFLSNMLVRVYTERQCGEKVRLQGLIGLNWFCVKHFIINVTRKTEQKFGVSDTYFSFLKWIKTNQTNKIPCTHAPENSCDFYNEILQAISLECRIISLSNLNWARCCGFKATTAHSQKLLAIGMFILHWVLQVHNMQSVLLLQHNVSMFKGAITLMLQSNRSSDCFSYI